MNFSEFVGAVKLHFVEYLGEDYTVSLNEVTKNNNIHLTGILMKKEGQKVTPNIYLNGYYEKYIEEDNLEQVLTEIWETYIEALRSFDSEHFDFEMDWETQKDFIVYRLINFKENEKKLENVPYFRFLDLAITFHCYVLLQDEIVSMLPVTNELMNHWKTDVKNLLRIASINTPRFLPLVSSTLEQVIQKLVDDAEFATLFPVDEDDVPMYVVTNVQGVNGASVMLYEEEFQKLAGTLGKKLYILPSSIHEIIVIPFDEEIEQAKLLELVRDVNQTQVPWEDILSNHVYLYNSETRSYAIL